MVLQGIQQTDQMLRRGPLPDIRSAEFSIFSQWGEDGIIQYLISRVNIRNKVFIEFGVESYRESNTRFLLLKDNWQGLVIDGGEDNIASIRAENWSWRHHLDAICSFITRDNINNLISGSGVTDDIGILSVDIDGNDYWVWEAIEVVSPRIVIAEYNGLWGAEAEVSVPYDEAFVRGTKHFSNLYYGASLKALIYLANRKNMAFVGSNSTGSNAFFVRRDVLGDLKEVTAEEEFITRKFREGRGTDGQLTFDGIESQRGVVGDLPLIRVRSNTLVKASEIFAGITR